MALVKKHAHQEIEDYPQFSSLDEVVSFFESSDDFDKKSYAIEEMVKFDGGAKQLVTYLKNPDINKEISSRMASVLSKLDAKKAPIEAVMELLQLDNAYTRNLGISILQDYGEAIKYYIVKFLIGDDRDLRIFAINVLGDVNFHESRDMLVELLETEDDINVAMTAVDYLSEIGEEKDIPLLESLKERFDDPYAHFAIDGAIRAIKG